MRRNRQRLAWAALVLASLPGLGCTRNATQQKQPPDPLLWSKRSVVGKSPVATEVQQTSRLDVPTPLGGKHDALASRPADPPAGVVPAQQQVTPLLADRAQARLLPPRLDEGR
jgi:hypothetical protein